MANIAEILGKVGLHSFLRHVRHLGIVCKAGDDLGVGGFSITLQTELKGDEMLQSAMTSHLFLLFAF